MKQTVELMFNIVSKDIQTMGRYQHSFPYEKL